MGLFTSNQPTPEIPPAQTWFDTLELSFADVSCNIEYTLRGQPTPKTDGIDTDAFLRAAKSAMTLFGAKLASFDHSTLLAGTKHLTSTALIRYSWCEGIRHRQNKYEGQHRS